MATLSDDVQNHVLRRIYRRLWEVDPKLFQGGEAWRPAGACELCDSIEHVIDATLRRSTRGQEEAKEHVCSNCYHRTPYGYCPFRTNCIFNRYHQLIMDAVAQAVGEEWPDACNNSNAFYCQDTRSSYEKRS